MELPKSLTENISTQKYEVAKLSFLLFFMQVVSFREHKLLH